MSVSSHRVALFLATALSTTVGLANAATITVNTTDDELNADGDCSLREAVVSANTNVAVDGCTGGVAEKILRHPFIRRCFDGPGSPTEVEGLIRSERF